MMKLTLYFSRSCRHPILEGKFLQLQFDGYSKLVGSRSITYLLEKVG